MKVLAPGKLVLTGAYAVLEGAPAIVVAVDRYAVADVASGQHADVQVDTRSMVDAKGRKLGLGSSAAWMVAAEGARVAARGRDLRDDEVRADLFGAVRETHARAQRGGSGIDVAASVYGGALRYELDGPRPAARPIALPEGLCFAAFWSGTSARTSELRARVDGLTGSARRFAFSELHAASIASVAAVEARDRPAFVQAASRFGRALADLGRAADAPIVPPSFAELARLAEREGAAFYPSGAGGGDVGVWLGSRGPSHLFVARAEALAMMRLDLGFDGEGVRLAIAVPGVSPSSSVL